MEFSVESQSKMSQLSSFHSIAYFAQNEGAGHFYHYHKSVQKAVQPEVREAFVYVPHSSRFAAEDPTWKKWFSPFYNRKSRHKFWKECIRLFRQPSSSTRIFFLEFFGRRDFFLYAFAAILFSKKCDQLWVLYRDDLEIRRPKDLKVIRFCSKLLNLFCRNRFVPLTDSSLLADFYQGWFGKKPQILPVLYAQFAPFKIIRSKKLICTWLGSPRADKGASEIAQLVEIKDVLAKQIELDVSGATYFPPVKNELDLHLRKAFLTEEEYAEALYRSHVVLLPYDPKKYARRTSGVFVEAILAGKFPIVRDGSWLAYELKRFDLKELIFEWGREGFFTDLFSVVQDKDVVKKLLEMQRAYQAFHGRENFAKSLQQLLHSSNKA